MATATEQRGQQSSASSAEEEIAASIALVLSGQMALPAGTTPLAAVALLLMLLPGFPVGQPEPAVRDAVARLIVEDPEPVRAATGALRRAYVDNLLYRAHYAIAAVKRVASDVASGDDLKVALGKEERFFSSHRDAGERRVAAARVVDAMVDLHGPILGWKHGHPTEPRPSHAAADGANFDPARIPLQTGALPGVLPNCTCTVVAPYPAARMLA